VLEAKQNESVHIAVTQFVGSVFLINKLYFAPIRVTVSGVRGPALKPGQVSSGPVSSGLQVFRSSGLQVFRSRSKPRAGVAFRL